MHGGGLLMAVHDRSSAWSVDRYLFRDDFARRDWMIYCIPYVANIFQSAPIFSHTFGSFPELMQAACDVCAQAWARGLPRRSQRTRAAANVGRDSNDEWRMEARFAQEAPRVARDRM
eukprot:1000472-Pyramimonas_sp.AAC.1